MNEIVKWGGILLLLTVLLVGCQPSPTPTTSTTVTTIANATPSSIPSAIPATASAIPTTSPVPRLTAMPVPGGRIAFVRNEDIYVINADGTGESNLTAHPAWDISPSWSPDSSQIAFASDRDRDVADYHIYVMNSDGSGVTQLTRGSGSYVLPLWSPDGSKIVYASAYPSDENMGLDIYVMNSDGSEQIELWSGLGLYDEIKPPYAWSPDGSQLAFIWHRYVYAIDYIGLEAIQLVDMPGVLLEDLAWSPDGTQVAFTFFDGQELADIYLVNHDGSGLTNLTADPDVYDRCSTWSPNGKQIAFARSGIDESDDGLWVTNADGSEMYRLTEKKGWQLAWSPDGSKVTFVNGKAIYIINADGSDLVQLTTGEYPVWSP